MRRFLKSLLGGACALALTASPALAITMPNTLISSPATSASSTHPVATLTGSCAAGSVAVVAVKTQGNYSGSPFSDSKSNVWTKGQVGNFSTTTVTLFWSVLTSALASGDTVGPNFTSADATTVIEASCAPDATAASADLFGSNGATISNPQSFPTSPTLGAPQYAYVAVYTDRNGPPATPTPSGWTQDSSSNPAGTAYFRLYYFLVTSQQTLSFSDTSGAGANWALSYQDFKTASTVYPTPASHPGQCLSLLHVSC